MKITIVTDEQVITGVALPSDRLRHYTDPQAAICKTECITDGGRYGVIITDGGKVAPAHSGAFGQDPMVPNHPLGCSCHTCQCNEALEQDEATQADETLPPCAEGDELHVVLKVTGVMNRNERRTG